MLNFVYCIALSSEVGFAPGLQNSLQDRSPIHCSIDLDSFWHKNERKSVFAVMAAQTITEAGVWVLWT